MSIIIWMAMCISFLFYACICTRGWKIEWRLCEMWEGKVRYLLFMLPGLCHVGCARMAGQKYEIKVFILGVGRWEGTGVCPALISLRVLCLFSLLFSLLRPTTLRRSVVTCHWIGLVTTVVYLEARPIQWQLMLICDMLNTAMDTSNVSTAAHH